MTLNTALLLGTDVPLWYITSKKTSNPNKMSLTIFNAKLPAFYMFRLVKNQQQAPSLMGEKNPFRRLRKWGFYIIISKGFSIQYIYCWCLFMAYTTRNV
jgi:hypothetical protein